MRTKLITATAAAALFAAGAAMAQNDYQSNQSNAPSSRHQTSTHATAPGTPDQQNRGAMQDQSGTNAQGSMGGMQNTSMGNDRDRDRDNDRTNVRVNTGAGGADRVRIRENGNRTNIRITPVQRTRIRDVVVREHGPRLTHVTFRVGVGARIPRTVRVAVLPPEIVAIAPQWAGYSYFEYGDQIVIVDPASFAIVATLPL